MAMEGKCSCLNIVPLEIYPRGAILTHDQYSTYLHIANDEKTTVVLHDIRLNNEYFTSINESVVGKILRLRKCSDDDIFCQISLRILDNQSYYFVGYKKQQHRLFMLRTAEDLEEYYYPTALESAIVKTFFHLLNLSPSRKAIEDHMGKYNNFTGIFIFQRGITENTNGLMFLTFVHNNKKKSYLENPQIAIQLMKKWGYPDTVQCCCDDVLEDDERKKKKNYYSCYLNKIGNVLGVVR